MNGPIIGNGHGPVNPAPDAPDLVTALDERGNVATFSPNTLAAVVPPAASPLEQRLKAEGFHYFPIAHVADINAIAGSLCGSCNAAHMLECRPYWNTDNRIRIIARCHGCGAESEV